MYTDKIITVYHSSKLDDYEQAQTLFSSLKSLGCNKIVYLQTTIKKYLLDLQKDIYHGIWISNQNYEKVMQQIKEPLLIVQWDCVLQNQSRIFFLCQSSTNRDYQPKQIETTSNQKKKNELQSQQYKKQNQGLELKQISSKGKPEQKINQLNEKPIVKYGQSKQQQKQPSQNSKNQSRVNSADNIDSEEQFNNQQSQEKLIQQNGQQQESIDSQQFKDQQNNNKSNNSNIQEEENQSIKSQEIYQEPKLFQQPQNIKNRKQIFNIIEQLYSKSSDIRFVETQYKQYIQNSKDFTELQKEYGIKQLITKNRLKAVCNGYIGVRGDGNCFYTAFGYQLLTILLFSYNNDEYNSFIDQIKSANIRMKIYHKDFAIDDQELEKEMLEDFIYQINELKNVINNQERNALLHSLFKEYTLQEEGRGLLYPLTIIFLRNLAYYLVKSDPEIQDLIQDQENLLIWETECNFNEVVIQILSTYLKVNVQILFFNNSDFNDRQYEQQSKNKIILLFRPGHYNIGLQNIDA